MELVNRKKNDWATRLLKKAKKQMLEKAKKKEYEKIVDFTMNNKFSELEYNTDSVPGGAELSVACHLADLSDVRSNDQVCMMVAFYSLAEKLVKADQTGMVLAAFDLINAGLNASKEATKNGEIEVTEEAILREVAKINAERNKFNNSHKPKS